MDRRRSRSPRSRYACASYYECSGCSHLWRSQSKSRLSEKKLCIRCGESNDPMDQRSRWSRDYKASINYSSYHQEYFLRVEVDPSQLQHGYITEVILSDVPGIKEALAESVGELKQDDVTNFNISIDELGQVEWTSLNISKHVEFSEIVAGSRSRHPKVDAAHVDVWMPTGYPQKFLELFRDKINWGFLVSAGGGHKEHACEKCSFYKRPCQLEIKQPLDDTMLKLHGVANEIDSEESLRSLLMNRIHAVPSEVVVGFEDDIDACINSAPEERAKAVDTARGTFLQVKIAKLEKHCKWLKKQLFEYPEMSEVEAELKCLEVELEKGPQPDAPQIYWEGLRDRINDKREAFRTSSASWKARFVQPSANGSFSSSSALNQPRLVDLSALCKRAKEWNEISALVQDLTSKASALKAPSVNADDYKKRSVAAVVFFDNARLAQNAIAEFTHLRNMQDLMEDEGLRVRVGLMGKQWVNWASLIFSHELMVERMQAGPLVTLIKTIADKHGIFGQICKVGNPEFDGREQFKVADPGELFTLGYMSDFKICDAENSGGQCTCLLDSEGLPIATSVLDPPSLLDCSEEMPKRIEALCGLKTKDDLVNFLQKFYARRDFNINIAASMRPGFEAHCESIHGQNQGSVISEASMISVMTFTSTPKCFLLSTQFRKASGEYVQAGDLVKGDILQNGAAVKFVRVHEKAQRDLVQIRTDNASLVVTSDHRIQLHGSRREVTAGDLQQ